MQKSTLLCSCLLLTLMTQYAKAQTGQYWDNNGASAPTSGTWDTSTKNWAPSTTLTASTAVFANGNSATFAAGSAVVSAQTITINSAITCANITNSTFTNGITFSGTGSLTLASGMNNFACGPDGNGLIFNVPVLGSGGIVQHGTGYIELEKTNNYAGGTYTTGGQIIYYYTNTSFGTGPITNGGTGGALVNNTSPAGAITITNPMYFAAAGYSVNLAGGSPVAGAPGTTFSGTVTLPAGGTTTINTSSTATQVIEISGAIVSTGAGANLTVADDGTLILAGANTYSGGTSISSPATLLVIGSSSVGPGNITNASIFNYNSSASQTVTAINNTGTFMVSNSGPFSVSGAVTSSGAMTFTNAGAVAISGPVTSTSTMTFTNSSSVTISDGINSSGAMTFAAAGAVTLSGPMTNTSTTTFINSGAATISGSFFNTSTMNFNCSTLQTITAMIYGSGSVVQNGSGELVLGSANIFSGTLTANAGTLDANVAGSIPGSVTINGSAVLELDTPTAMSLDAIINLVSAPASGTVFLNYTGTQTVSTVMLGSTPLASGIWGAPGSGAPNTSPIFSGTGFLDVGGFLTSVFYWDPNALLASPGSGGSGNWDNVTSDWLAGSVDATWTNGEVAEFAGAAGTVTLATNVSPGAIDFVTPGYTVTNTVNGSVNLDTPFTQINVAAGTATIAAPIIGQGVVINGPGTLALNGVNTYASGTTLNSGANVSVNSLVDTGGSLGTGPVIVSNSTIVYTGAGDSTVRTIYGYPGTSNFFNVPTGVTENLNGPVTVTTSGTWYFNKTGGGTLVFGGGGNDAYTGMDILAGTVILNKSASSAIGSPFYIWNGATLQLEGASTSDIYSGSTTPGTIYNGGLFDMNSKSATVYSLALYPGGQIINSQSGTTSTLASGGGTFNLMGNYTLGGANNVGNLDITGVIAGDFSLTYAGTGALTLAAANTFNGGLNLNPGTSVYLTNTASPMTSPGQGSITLGANSTLYIGVDVANGIFQNPVIGPSTASVVVTGTPSDNFQINSDMSQFTGNLDIPPSAGYTAQKVQIYTDGFTINPAATINVSNQGSLYVVGNNLAQVPCTVNFYGVGDNEVYGALRIENGGIISGPVHLYGNTTMGNNQSGAAKFGEISGPISSPTGNYGISFTAIAGTIILAGPNTYKGNNVFSNSCVIQLGSPENPGVSGPLGEPATVANSMTFYGGTIQFTNGNNYDYSARFSSLSTGYHFDVNGQTVTFASPIPGAANATLACVSSSPGGTLILSGANTYNGTNTLTSGTVQLAHSDAGTSGPLGAGTTVGSIVMSGAILQHTAANTHDYSPRLSTAGSQDWNIDVNGQPVTYATALVGASSEVTVYSSTPGGSLTLGGLNTYTGNTTILPGATLIISGDLGNSSGVGTYAGAGTSAAPGIYDEGTLSFASSDNQTLNCFILGAGTLTKSGTGTLSLTASNQYVGPTTVNAGTLYITSTGNILGNVTVTGGVLELGNTSALEAGAAVTLPASPASGTVNLNYSGTLPITALNFGTTSMPAGTYGSTSSAATYKSAVFTGAGILSVGAGGTYWDPSLSDSAPGSGGTGSWDLSTSDWFNGSGDVKWTNGNIPTFAGSNGTVTLNATLNANGLAFATPGYTINGNSGVGSTLNLTGPNANSTPVISVPAGNTTLACPISATVVTNELIVSGPGTLTVTGANSFTNSVVVTGGATLSFNSINDTPGNTSALGFGSSLANSGLALVNGNLTFTGASGQTARDLTLEGSTTCNLNVPTGDTLEIDGQIREINFTTPLGLPSAAQALTFTGGGTFIMGGSLNDNSGLDINIAAGTVIINKQTQSTAHGVGGGTSIIGPGATLQLAGSGGFDIYSGSILMVSNGGVLDLNGQGDTFATLNIGGSGIGGSGALINSSAGSTASISPAISLLSPTTIGGSGNITLTGIIAGFENPLSYIGGGTLVLSGANTFNGGLNVGSGSTVNLTVVQGGGVAAINLSNNATLLINNGLNVVNPITGSTSSTIILSSTSTANWSLTAELSSFQGTLDVENNDATGLGTQLLINNINNEAYPINANATWQIQNGVTVDMVTPFTNDPATVQVYGIGNNAYGALRLDCCTQSGNVILEGGGNVCQIGSGFNSVPNGPNVISGVISDGGNNNGFVWMSAANPGPTLILTAVNTYTGPTYVSNATTLAIGASGSIATSSAIYLSSGTVFDVSRVSGSYAITANQSLANLSGTATINGSLTLNSAVPITLVDNGTAAPLIVTNGTMTLNNNPISVTLASTVVPNANGYPLISGANGGTVTGNVSSSPLTLNGQAITPGGSIGLSIIGGTLYLVATSPQLFVGPIPLNPVIYATPTNSITFSATVFGNAPLTNQWYTNGTPVPGGTNTSVTLTNVPLGSYMVTFGSTNAFPPVAVGSTTLTTIAPPTNAFPVSVLSYGPIGYWRLNEPDDGLNDNNNGQICHDYVTGKDGIYTNTALGLSGYDSIDSGGTNFDPETSALFGYYNNPNSCAFGIPNIDVSAPTNHSPTFTVMAWVQASNTMPTTINTPGIVGKGIYNQEEFTIDCGTHIGVLDAYRFSVRNAAGTVFNAGSTLVAGSDTNWHFLVGVCDEVHSNITLYIDGTNAASAVLLPSNGITAAAASFPMSIGARSSAGVTAAGTSYDQQFSGSINDVAIFTNALTSNQIQAQYFLAGIAPTVSLTNYNYTVNQYGSIFDTANTYGTPPLALQWYYTDNNNNIYTATGQTNATIDLTNIQGNWQSLYVVVTNAYGSVTSTPAALTVNSGAAQIQVQPTPSIIYVPVGTVLSYSVVAYGTDPIYYEWLNGGSAINEATNATYTFAAVAGTNTYTVGVSNSQNSSWNLGNPVTVVAENTPPVVNFANPSDWSFQTQSGSFTPSISGGVLETTSAAGSESTGSFYIIPQYISNGFIASFTYTPSGGTATRADGTAFVLQNSVNGYTAVGTGGGGLGVDGITPSVDFCMDLYTGTSGGTGINWGTNGATGGAGGAPNGGTGSSVNINSLDPISVVITYTTTPSYNVQVVLTDAIHPSETFTTNYHTTNIAALLGSTTAYVGFTGGTGNDDAEQQIGNFDFVYTAPLEGPIILNDISPTNIDAPAGAQVTYSVEASGTAPLYYYWYENGVVVQGATSSSYTFAAPAGANTFQCGVSNAAGGNVLAYSSVATLTAEVTPPVVGFGNASLWQVQGTVAALSSGVLTLTTSAIDQYGSAFYTIPQYINNGFMASFIYTPSGGSATRADGTAFVLQNSYEGPSALINAGGGNTLGVNGISPCVDFCMDLYSGTSGGTGINWGTNGTTGGVGGPPNGGTGSVNINSLDPIAVTIAYHPETGFVAVTLEDTLTSATYSTNYAAGANLAALAGGDTAYVGFTAATGGSDAEQQVSNFAFTYTGPAAAIIEDLTPLNYSATVGNSIGYSVVASGDQPISYAWFTNSSLVAGATTASYTLVIPAGNTTVQCGVSNSYNSTYALSSVATVVGTVPSAPTLSIQQEGTNIVLTWSGGNLFSTTNLAQPWTPVTGATSPYTTNTAPASSLFFKAGVPY